MNKVKVYVASAICCLAVAGGVATKSFAHGVKKDSQVSQSSILIPAKGAMAMAPCVCPKTSQCP